MLEEQLEALEKVVFDAQLVIAGFAEGGIPVLFSVNEDLYSKNAVPLRRDENFVAVGSGAPSALISLYRRKHIGTEVPVTQALYHVFEAMVLSGEVSPGVGKETMSIEVLSPDNPSALAE